MSTIVDGQGLNITVQSYLDTLDFGLVGCRELVPDIWDLLDDIIDDIVALGAAVGVDVDVDTTGPQPRSRAATTARPRRGDEGDEGHHDHQVGEGHEGHEGHARSTRKAAGGASGGRKAAAKRITKAAARAAS